ncbi:immunoglobulin superfamily DCC subclass member 4-like [Acipenser oxyrinchus oxyrinchus]|nr:immunoglobulin superfamily DCC subclass member 4-like [Acipenser oxyrinchus oxyrinchus]
MALDGVCFLCLASLTLAALLTAQDKAYSLELSCSAGPVHFVVEPAQELMLDCNLPVVEQPAHISWEKDGVPVVSDGLLQVLPNGSLSILQAVREGRVPERRGSAEGSYTCTVSSSFRAIASRTAVIRDSTLSRFLQHPESQVVQQGGLARFQCRIDGLPTPLITWEKDQSLLPNEARFTHLPNGVLQIVNVQEEDAGAYRCVAANVARTRYSQDATLTVTEGPPSGQGDVVIIAAPKNTTVVAGKTAVMECMAQADPTPFVSWIRQDGKPIATDAVVLSTNLLIADTQSYHAGVYVCRANKPKTRQFVNAAAALRVLAPPVITQLPETISRTRASTGRFVCKASGEPAPAITWMKNGQPIHSNGRVKIQSSGSLVINQIGVEDSGYYQCIAENNLGTACAIARLSVIVREGLPSNPHSVSASTLSSTTVLVTWERPEHNSERIIGFSLHYQRAAGGTDNVENQFAVNNDTTEFQVKDLEPNTNYTFYVVAYSPLGASRTSNSVTVHTSEDVPSAPPQLSLLSTTPTDIRVMWFPLSAELSQGKVTKYRIDYCTVEEVDQIYSIEVAGNETQVPLHSLHPNKTYKVRIAAGTSAGFGDPSEWTQHRTPNRNNQTMDLFAPLELKVRAKVDSLHVMWQPPSNHAQISGYKLYYREAELENLANEDLPDSPRKGTWASSPIRLKKKVKQYEITGLAPDRLYEVKVMAFSKHEDGYAAVWKGRTERAPLTMGEPPVQTVPPLPPSSVQAASNSSTSIWLRWEKPSFSTVKIVNYTVRCNPWGVKNASLVSYYISSEEQILLTGLKPYTKYELAVQSNTVGVDGPFSKVVKQSTLPDRPSTPPSELQLSPLGPHSVLVRWQPPLEPNGLIVEYMVLYNSNSTQPDSMWSSLSREGNIFSAEVNGLESGTRYFFKMGAKTVMGAGPYSQVKEAHALPEKHSKPDILDVHSVTGIIVGVCLGLLCILLCMWVSFRTSKQREIPQGSDLNSSTSPHSLYRKGRSAPATQLECHDCHELETLMSPWPEDTSQPLTEITELTEEQSLMGTSLAEDSLHIELRPAWNGSVSRNWTNNITSYRDTITEGSPAVTNGAMGPPSEPATERLLQTLAPESSKSEVKNKATPLVGTHQMEALVIVHSELSESDRNGAGPAQSTQGHDGKAVEEEESDILLTNQNTADSNEAGREGGSPVLLNHNGKKPGKPESGDAHGLPNGFHSAEEHNRSLQNGDTDSLQHDNRNCQPAKCQPFPRGPQEHPQQFVSSGIINSTSTTDNHLCP